MEVVGVVFEAMVSVEAPPGKGWTGPGAGWQPQSWQTACGEMAISWVTVTVSSSFISEVICPFSPSSFFFSELVSLPLVHFLEPGKSVFVTPFGGKL